MASVEPLPPGLTNIHDLPPKEHAVKIADILLHRIHGPYQGPVFPPGHRQARALDIYPEFNQPGREQMNRLTPGDRLEAIYVEIVTEEGASGLWGPIEEYQAFPIFKTLRPFLLGRDALATELLFDQMARLDRHGRAGYLMTAISAIDCALWDLKGKVWDLPVYRLLGGPTRPAVPAYASMLGYAVDPDQAATVAAATKTLGYSAQKWFFRYGPGDGESGKELNVALARAVRAAVGPGYKLMFDAYMGWDTTYAVEMVKELAAINPVWLEEPVPPERMGALARIRAASSVPVATGEHVYTRWQAKELLVNGAVDFLQNDPDWTGGISELVKICALGSAFEVPVVAHGHSLLPALHVAGAQSPATVPMVEFLIRFQESKQNFHHTVLRPEEGLVVLPSAPGLGFQLDEAKIDGRTELRYT